MRDGVNTNNFSLSGQFEAFTESGHMLFYEEAAKFNAVMRDFVNKCNA